MPFKGMYSQLKIVEGTQMPITRGKDKQSVDMENYSALTKKNTVAYVTTWMNFEGIVLNEIRCILLIYWNTQCPRDGQEEEWVKCETWVLLLSGTESHWRKRKMLWGMEDVGFTVPENVHENGLKSILIGFLLL